MVQVIPLSLRSSIHKDTHALPCTHMISRYPLHRVHNASPQLNSNRLGCKKMASCVGCGRGAFTGAPGGLLLRSFDARAGVEGAAAAGASGGLFMLNDSHKLAA